MINRKTIIAVLLILLSAFPAFAVTVITIDGDELEGEIASAGDKGIVLEKSGTQKKLYWSDIKYVKTGEKSGIKGSEIAPPYKTISLMINVSNSLVSGMETNSLILSLGLPLSRKYEAGLDYSLNSSKNDYTGESSTGKLGFHLNVYFFPALEHYFTAAKGVRSKIFNPGKMRAYYGVGFDSTVQAGSDTGTASLKFKLGAEYPLTGNASLDIALPEAELIAGMTTFRSSVNIKIRIPVGKKKT